MEWVSITIIIIFIFFCLKTYINKKGVSSPIGIDGTYADTLGPVIFQSCDKLATDGNPKFSSDAASVNSKKLCKYIQGWERIKTNYTSLRLVSAGVQLEFTGPDTNNSGSINMAVVNNLDAINGTNENNSVPTPGLWTEANLGGATAATAVAYGITRNMLLNARTGFSGPAKYGGFYAYRPQDPIVPFTAPRIADLPPAGAPYFDEMLVIEGQVQNDGASGDNPDTNSQTIFRVKITANYEGTVKDSTYPRPPENASPMDIYGLQCAVEAALATSRLGSLSNGPDATWNRLQNTGLSKFTEVVSMSQGR